MENARGRPCAEHPSRQQPALRARYAPSPSLLKAERVFVEVICPVLHANENAALYGLSDEVINALCNPWVTKN